MTAREYLKQMRTIKYQINVKKRELKDLTEDFDIIRSPALGERVKGGIAVSFTSAVEKAIQLDEDIRRETAKKIEQHHEVHFMLQMLDNELYSSLLTDRYINNRRSGEIANEICYDAAYVRALTAKALERFVEIYGDDF